MNSDLRALSDSHMEVIQLIKEHKGLGARHWLLCQLALAMANYYGAGSEILTRGGPMARVHIWGGRILERPFRMVSAAIDKIPQTV